MFLLNGSGKPGARLVSIGAVALLIVGIPLASAETVLSINGRTLESEVVDSYIIGRVQKPIEQVTEEERTFLVDELTDIFVLSTTDTAENISKKPEIAAQIELQRMGILARAVIAEMITDIAVSEEEIQATYEEQIKLSPTMQYMASHILVETQAEALEIIEALLAGGNFEELAKEKSTGPSGPAGGSLGDWFTADQMVKPFSDAVAKLADGRYATDPVQTQFGWHVIRRDETRQAAPPPLESVRENIVARVQSEKLKIKIDALTAAAIKK